MYAHAALHAASNANRRHQTDERAVDEVPRHILFCLVDRYATILVAGLGSLVARTTNCPSLRRNHGLNRPQPVWNTGPWLNPSYWQMRKRKLNPEWSSASGRRGGLA